MIGKFLTERNVQIRLVQTIVSGLFYWNALFSTCISFDPAKYGSYAQWTGFGVLVFGWIGVIFLQFAWMANILPFLAVCFAWEGKPRKSAKAAAIALVLAMETFVHARQYPGFYWWIASMAVWISNLVVPDVHPPLADLPQANDISTSSPQDAV